MTITRSLLLFALAALAEESPLQEALGKESKWGATTAPTIAPLILSFHFALLAALSSRILS